jgi:hypothetical protein
MSYEDNLMSRFNITLEGEELGLILTSIQTQIQAFEGLITQENTPRDRIPVMKRFITTFKQIETKLKKAGQE